MEAERACAPYDGNIVLPNKIHLVAGKQKDLVIQARDGYYFGQYRIPLSNYVCWQRLSTLLFR